MAEKMLKVAEVAERARVDPETVRRWLRVGTLRGVRVGPGRGSYRIPESEVDRMLQIPSTLGDSFEAWKAKLDKTDEELAKHIGVPTDRLPAMAAERQPFVAGGSPTTGMSLFRTDAGIERIAHQYDAIPGPTD